MRFSSSSEHTGNVANLRLCINFILTKSDWRGTSWVIIAQMKKLSFSHRLLLTALAVLPATLWPGPHGEAPAELRGPIAPAQEGVQSPKNWQTPTIFRNARHFEISRGAEKRLS